MDSSGGGGGGGPAPFLLKTYEMVDDSSTDEIVSWSSAKNSFVVWNSLEFARILLPTYFKHNNFSSFIRQLNTYGFRKIDPERWEFANEEFIKDQKHLLKNIHRRKPIHSHSLPHGSIGDSERAALEEEIEKLSQERASLQKSIWRVKQQKTTSKLELEDLEKRVVDMENRQLRLMSFLVKAANSSTFRENLIKMAGSQMEFSAIYKKRRLPAPDSGPEVEEICFVDNNSGNTKPDHAHVVQRDFSNKLKLQLSPAVSNSGMVSMSELSSSEDGASPQMRVSVEDPKDVNMTRMDGVSIAAETLEPSDMGLSFALGKDVPLPREVRVNNFTSIEEADGHMSCHLNLTLASSSLQVDTSHYSVKIIRPSQEILASTDSRSNGSRKAVLRVDATNKNAEDDHTTMTSSQDTPVNNNGSGAPHGRVNDVFWEQFLTERPGSCDNEEASSSLRENAYDDQEEKKAADGLSWRTRKDMEQLTL